MLALGDLLTEVQRKTPVVHVVFNNSPLDFVNVEQQEARSVPFGTDFVNPDFSRVAEALGAVGIRITGPADVRHGLQAALRNTGGPGRRRRAHGPVCLSLPAHVSAETVGDFTLSLARQAVAGQRDEVIETVEHNIRLV